MRVYRRRSERGVDGDGRRYTYMNETRNETNWPPSPMARAGPGDLTFPLLRRGVKVGIQVPSLLRI